MNASWVGSIVGLLAAILIASPISEALWSSSFSDDRLDVPRYEYALSEHSPLIDTVKVGEEAQAPQEDARFLLPYNWNPLVRHATEPSALVLLGTGLLGIATLLRRRQRPSK